jgi:predicted small integral membrane protein
MIANLVILAYLAVLLFWLAPGALRLLAKEMALGPLRREDPGAFERCFGWWDRAIAIGFVVWLVSFVALLWWFDRKRW